MEEKRKPIETAYLEIQGDVFERLRETENMCGDCGATEGEYHHLGCDMERCPKCRGQLISCDCEDIYLMEEGNK